jgi:hypothetical protein
MLQLRFSMTTWKELWQKLIFSVWCHCPKNLNNWRLEIVFISYYHKYIRYIWVQCESFHTNYTYKMKTYGTVFNPHPRTPPPGPSLVWDAAVYHISPPFCWTETCFVIRNSDEAICLWMVYWISILVECKYFWRTTKTLWSVNKWQD